jgi:DNA-directed RNA polymerase subunit M/transcription elongation factor TFIIS
MEFCDKCGKPLQTRKDNEMDILIGYCSCGFKKLIAYNKSYSDIQKKKEIGKGVLEKQESTEGFPHVCKKCGFDKADVVELGIPYSDESAVFLFKCKKCSYVERQSDGTGN